MMYEKREGDASWEYKDESHGLPRLMRKGSDHPPSTSLSQHRAKTEPGFGRYDRLNPATTSPQVPASST